MLGLLFRSASLPRSNVKRLRFSSQLSQELLGHPGEQCSSNPDDLSHEAEMFPWLFPDANSPATPWSTSLPNPTLTGDLCTTQSSHVQALPRFRTIQLQSSRGPRFSFDFSLDDSPSELREMVQQLLALETTPTMLFDAQRQTWVTYRTLLDPTYQLLDMTTGQPRIFTFPDAAQ